MLSRARSRNLILLTGCLLIYACSYGGRWKPVPAVGIQLSSSFHKKDTATQKRRDVSLSARGYWVSGSSTFVITLSNQSELPTTVDLKNSSFTMTAKGTGQQIDLQVSSFIQDPPNLFIGPGHSTLYAQRIRDFASEEDYFHSLPLTIQARESGEFFLEFVGIPQKGSRGRLRVPLVQGRETLWFEYDFRAAR